jgi:hypothetical protein
MPAPVKVKTVKTGPVKVKKKARTASGKKTTARAKK